MVQLVKPFPPKHEDPSESPASTFKTNKIKSDGVAGALDYCTREAKTGGCLGLNGRQHQLIQ